MSGFAPRSEKKLAGISPTPDAGRRFRNPPPRAAARVPTGTHATRPHAALLTAPQEDHGAGAQTEPGVIAAPASRAAARCGLAEIQGRALLRVLPLVGRELEFKG